MSQGHSHPSSTTTSPESTVVPDSQNGDFGSNALMQTSLNVINKKGADCTGGKTTRLGLARALLETMGVPCGENASTDGQMAVEEGIFDNKSDLHLEDPVIRNEAAKMVSEALNLPTLSEGEIKRTFPDVAANHWSAAYIYGAVQHGVLNGYSDGEFKPKEPLEHQHLAGFISKAGQAKEELRQTGSTTLDKTFDPTVAASGLPVQGPVQPAPIEMTRVLMDVTIFDGVDPGDVHADIEYANTIYMNYGIELVANSWVELDDKDTQRILMENNTLEVESGGGTELEAILDLIKSGTGLSAVWVPALDHVVERSSSEHNILGLHIPWENVDDSGGFIVIDAGHDSRITLAHEVAHALVGDVSENPQYDGGSHFVGNPNNILACGSALEDDAHALSASQVELMKANASKYT